MCVCVWVCLDVLGDDDRPLVSVCPSDSLLDAISRLSDAQVHRLLVVNPVTGNALHVLTYRRILQFIHVCVCKPYTTLQLVVVV